jgi:hypothetical protein
MDDTMIALVASEARGAMPKDGDLQAKAEAAMRSAAHHWMVLDPDVQFKGALAALLLEYPESTPEHTRIRAEIGAMRKLAAIIGAAQAGIPLDLAAIAENPTPDFERIGLADMWRRVRAE